MRNCNPKISQPCGNACVSLKFDCNLSLTANVSNSLSRGRDKAIGSAFSEEVTADDPIGEEYKYRKLIRRNTDSSAVGKIEVPGELVSYTIENSSFLDISNIDDYRKIDSQSLERLIESQKWNGKMQEISWDKNPSAITESNMRTALEARRMWQDTINPMIEDGTILRNYPLKGADGARDRAYRRMGFSRVNQDGVQYAIKLQGRLVPLNIFPVSSDYAT